MAVSSTCLPQATNFATVQLKLPVFGDPQQQWWTEDGWEPFGELSPCWPHLWCMWLQLLLHQCELSPTGRR